MFLPKLSMIFERESLVLASGQFHTTVDEAGAGLIATHKSAWSKSVGWVQ
jgi:hypothetical protein